jgi:cell cycle arrest protein BUB3
VISGSWDRTLRVWDPKSANALQSTLPLPERAYKADLVGTTLVLALGSRLFHIYDTRALSRGPVQTRESALKFLTRSVAVMAGGEGYAAGSVEGRVAVEYTDAGAAAQERKYAFKCHRAAAGDVDHVWAVNALAFHPTYNTFASGGADGTVSVWDHTSKKRLRQLPKFGAGVAALAFAPDGGRLAVAAGYGWDEGGAAGAAAAGPASLHVFTLGDDAKVRVGTAGTGRAWADVRCACSRRGGRGREAVYMLCVFPMLRNACLGANISIHLHRRHHAGGCAYARAR